MFEAFRDRREVWASGRTTPGVVDVVAGGDDPVPWLAHPGTLTRFPDCEDPSVRLRLAVVSEAVAAFDNMEVGNHRHWDLTPGDLWLPDPDPEMPTAVRADVGEFARVGDWGLRRAVVHAAGDDPAVTPYDAPEQLAPDRYEPPEVMNAYLPEQVDVDTELDLEPHHAESMPWIDSYRTGAVAYRVLTGRPPFDPEGDLRTAILEGEVPAPTEADPSLPAGVDGVVAALTHEEPSQRPMVAWVDEDWHELFEETRSEP